MKWQRWHGALAIALAGVGVYALTRGGSGDKSPDFEDAGAEPVAKAPDDLIAELYVGSPNATWTKLQRGIGGAAGILPATMPGVIVAMSDLDPTLAGELDGTAPIYGALSGDPTDPEWALALKLSDGRHARGLLIDGDTARFNGKQAPGMTILVPKTVASVGEETKQVAITSNGWLLVAKKAADLAGLGNYVTRGLAVRPTPTENASIIVDVPRSALAKQIAPKLGEMWAGAKQYLLGEDARMRAERGRAPDFADPAALVAALDGLVTRRLAIAGDLDKVHVAIDVTSDSASILATLTPVKGDGPAHQWVDGMRTGDAAAALALPATSVLALSTRDDAAARTEQGKSLETTVATALGARLKDPAPLNTVVDLATSARDESFAIAWTSEEPSGVMLRAAVKDADAAQKAMNGAIDLAKADPFKDLFRLAAVTPGSEDIAGLGTVKSAIFTPAVDPKAGNTKNKPKPRGVAWVVSGNVLYAATGHEATVTLKISAKPEKKLADEPAIAKFVTAIGADASTVAIAQPLKLDPRKAALPTQPVTLAVGKHGSDAFVRIDLPDPLVREVMRSQMGL